MNARYVLLFVLSINAAYLTAQEADKSQASARENLRSEAWLFAYPNGLLFHNAFKQGITTRFLLLKTSLKSDQLATYLSLDDSQRKRISEIRASGLQTLIAEKDTDANEQPDEQLLDRDYFNFLRSEQLRRLDAIAFRYDGYAALTRISLANHLELSDNSRAQIAHAVKAIRDNAIFPQSWRRFGGPQRPDAEYRDCQFAGGVCTQLNLQIIDILTDDECSRLHDFLKAESDWAVVSSIDQLAALPHGVWSLADRLDNENLLED